MAGTFAGGVAVALVDVAGRSHSLEDGALGEAWG